MQGSEEGAAARKDRRGIQNGGAAGKKKRRIKVYIEKEVRVDARGTLVAVEDAFPILPTAGHDSAPDKTMETRAAEVERESEDRTTSSSALRGEKKVEESPPRTKSSPCAGGANSASGGGTAVPPLEEEPDEVEGEDFYYCEVSDSDAASDSDDEKAYQEYLGYYSAKAQTSVGRTSIGGSLLSKRERVLQMVSRDPFQTVRKLLRPGVGGERAAGADRDPPPSGGGGMAVLASSSCSSAAAAVTQRREKLLATFHLRTQHTNSFAEDGFARSASSHMFSTEHARPGRSSEPPPLISSADAASGEDSLPSEHQHEDLLPPPVSLGGRGIREEEEAAGGYVTPTDADIALAIAALEKIVEPSSSSAGKEASAQSPLRTGSPSRRRFSDQNLVLFSDQDDDDGLRLPVSPFAYEKKVPPSQQQPPPLTLPIPALSSRQLPMPPPAGTDSEKTTTPRTLSTHKMKSRPYSSRSTKMSQVSTTCSSGGLESEYFHGSDRGSFHASERGSFHERTSIDFGRGETSLSGALSVDAADTRRGDVDHLPPEELLSPSSPTHHSSLVDALTWIRSLSPLTTTNLLKIKAQKQDGKYAYLPCSAELNSLVLRYQIPGGEVAHHGFLSERSRIVLRRPASPVGGPTKFCLLGEPLLSSSAEKPRAALEFQARTEAEAERWAGALALHASVAQLVRNLLLRVHPRGWLEAELPTVSAVSERRGG